MNEKRIQQVLDIERQAKSLHESALNDARQLPAQAEEEAQQIIEKARRDAEAEASQLLTKAQSQEESNRILAEAEEKIRRMDTIARRNLDRAVTDVLCQIAGKE